jgi:hypothetical protein
MRYIAVFCALACAALACGQSFLRPEHAVLQDGSVFFNSGWFKNTFEQMLRDDPEYATSTGRHEYDDRWTDWSKGARDKRRRFFEQRLSQVSSVMDDTLSQKASSAMTSHPAWRPGILTRICSAWAR